MERRPISRSLFYPGIGGAGASSVSAISWSTVSASRLLESGDGLPWGSGVPPSVGYLFPIARRSGHIM
jgi:hypothetical protein